MPQSTWAKRPKSAASGLLGQLYDRIVCALLCAVLGLLIASPIWFWAAAQHTNGKGLSFAPVLYFSAVMAALGFLLKDKWVANIFGWILEATLAGSSRR